MPDQPVQRGSLEQLAGQHNLACQCLLGRYVEDARRRTKGKQRQQPIQVRRSQYGRGQERGHQIAQKHKLRFVQPVGQRSGKRAQQDSRQRHGDRNQRQQKRINSPTVSDDHLDRQGVKPIAKGGQGIGGKHVPEAAVRPQGWTGFVILILHRAFLRFTFSLQPHRNGTMSEENQTESDLLRRKVRLN